MKLLKAGKIITLVAEIVGIIGAILCLAMTVMAFVNPQWLLENGTLTVNGIEISKPMELVKDPMVPLAIVFFAGVGVMGITALMFHRMRGIIMETMAGKPFQPCTVKWMRQIGYCAVSMPLVSVVMSLGAMLIGVDGIFAELDFSGIMMGILVLCLTQVFAYGLELQKDVDGLL